MEYTIDALNHLNASLNATGVLSDSYKSLIMQYALACVSEGHAEGRKREQERQEPAKLTKAGDELQSAASRLAGFVGSYERSGGRVPYEVRMAVLEAEAAVHDWTNARLR